MANNLAQLKTDIKTSLTANLDATTRTKLLNRFVAEYQPEWNAWLAADPVNNTDTVANRGDFVVTKVMDFLKSIFRAQSAKENLAALPTPEVIS